MRFLKLTIAYDGSNYVGWQVQPNGISIQHRLEESWYQVTGEKIRITASGRTDAGVHAVGQVCSLSTESQLDLATLRRAVNANLPDDISVLTVNQAPNDFHAIRDATSKTYGYHIQHGPVRNPLAAKHRWYIPIALDIEAMIEASQFLIGEQDFASFQAAGAERKSTVRHLSQLDIFESTQQHFHYVKFELTSNGFLYNMVRNIVGTIVKVGQRKRPATWIEEVIDAKDRSVAGPTAPAHALILQSVEYAGIQFTGPDPSAG